MGDQACVPRFSRSRTRGVVVPSFRSTTQIVPVVIGDNDTTMSVCEDLLARGFYAQGIRYPSVPEGTSRLRITPMATHREDEIEAFVDALVQVLAQRSPHVLESAGPSRQRAAGA